ncbi:hypothetical protein COT48_00985 [Candidatus Woesearchaeota archaeon CG08_land_8_20_14_0_20_47_9]|nr:MAG: hypothetical protein COT48_00985 [Candidatus Woesearchaeota archaeon CG08_land_8_20_14_0_20_47_9]
MHELAIVSSLIDAIREKADGKRVSSATIALGELAPISAADLKELVEKIGGFKANVRLTPARVRCSCGHSGRPRVEERQHDVVVFSCAKCGSMPEVCSGGDVVIKKLEF